MQSLDFKSPGDCNCCEAFLQGLKLHLGGLPLEAVSYYNQALTGSHKTAAIYKDWAVRDLPLSDFAEFQDIENHSSSNLEEVIWKSSHSINEALNRSISLAFEISIYLSKKASAIWHRLKLLSDARVLGYTKEGIRSSVGEIGPLHNDLDAHGCPIPGSYRPKVAGDRQGWTEISAVQFKGGVAKIRGIRSRSIPALVTDDDIDVAMALAFLDSAGPTCPSFSLEPCEKLSGHRFDRKEFNPVWLGNTDFGKSMFFADWLMKSMTMIDGLPSIINPTQSLACQENPEVPDLIREIGEASGDSLMPDGRAADSGRLEIVVDGVDLEVYNNKGIFRTVQTYVLTGYRVKIESSLIHYLPDGTEDRTIRPNDPTTSPGASAFVIQRNYDAVAALFPVFHRVRVLLSLYSLFGQARADGIRLSPAELTRLALVRSKAERKLRTKCLIAPKPFHKNGCSCSGGVSGRNSAHVHAVRQDAPLLLEDHSKNRFRILENGEKVSTAGYTIKPNLVKSGSSYTWDGSMHHTVYFGADVEGMKSIRLSWDEVDGKKVRIHMTDLQAIQDDGRIGKKIIDLK